MWRKSGRVGTICFNKTMPGKIHYKFIREVTLGTHVRNDGRYEPAMKN